jgi:hypothetical protein
VVIALLLSFQSPAEADFYPVTGVEPPEKVVLEVGGIALLADGRPLVCTRRGEVWLLDNAYSSDGKNVVFHKWFDGLQEPLGLLVDGEWVTSSSAASSKLRDVDNDGAPTSLSPSPTPAHQRQLPRVRLRPRVGPDKRLWITLNRPFGEPFGHVEAGFALAIDPASGAGSRSAPGCVALWRHDSPWGEVLHRQPGRAGWHEQALPARARRLLRLFVGRRPTKPPREVRRDRAAAEQDPLARGRPTVPAPAGARDLSHDVRGARPRARGHGGTLRPVRWTTSSSATSTTLR